MLSITTNTIFYGDNLEILKRIPTDSVQLVYVDPPFNTGRAQSRLQLKTERSENGDRVGFKGERYETTVIGQRSFNDSFDDFIGFIKPRLVEAHRILSDTGSFYFHIDYREVHYCKVLLDEIFGYDNFINEIIWAYDYGARTTKKWSAKHDNILLYVKDPDNYFFNEEAMSRIEFADPGFLGGEPLEKGKPTDTWWHTIVSPTGKEKTGYPTQKPLGVLGRIVEVSSKPGDWVMDFFAGSGTTGLAAAKSGRRFILMDNNPEAIKVMSQRLSDYNVEFVGAGEILDTETKPIQKSLF